MCACVLECACASCGVGGAALQQEGVAGVAHPDGFGRGGERQLVVGAVVAENLPAVATVVLGARDGGTERKRRRERERDAVREVLVAPLDQRQWAGPAPGLTFLREMENSFSHSLQWLASLSFNHT